jgi:hypothetical protein
VFIHRYFKFSSVERYIGHYTQKVSSMRFLLTPTAAPRSASLLDPSLLEGSASCKTPPWGLGDSTWAVDDSVTIYSLHFLPYMISHS